MIVDHPDDLERAMAPPGLKEAVIHSGRRLEQAETMRMFNDDGMDLTVSLGEYPTMIQYGFAEEPGRFDHWGAGHVHTFPNEGSANGTVVVRPGDFVVLPYNRYVTDEIRLEIRDGFIRKIDGGLDARLMDQWLDDNRADAEDMDGTRSRSRLGSEPAIPLGQRGALRRRTRPLELVAARVRGEFPVLDRAQLAGRRQPNDHRPLRRADARLLDHARQRSDPRQGAVHGSRYGRGTRRPLKVSKQERCRMKKTIGTAFAVALAGAIALLGSTAANAADPVKIGFSESRRACSQGRDSQYQSYNLWREQVNAAAARRRRAKRRSSSFLRRPVEPRQGGPEFTRS